MCGWRLVAWAQAQRRPFAQLVDGYHRHRGWAKPSGSAVSHHASVHADDGSGGAPPIDCPEGVERGGITYCRDHCDQAEPVRLLSEKSGQESTPKKVPDTDAIFAQMKQCNEEADTSEEVLRLSLDAKAIVKVGP